MKTNITFLFLLSSVTALEAADNADYTNFIRQTQFPTGVQWDATVAAEGSEPSALAIDPGGARFDLWTVKSSPTKSYLLDSDYVGAFVPQATIVIRSEDPYGPIPRTRADRPFYVDVTVSGIMTGATVPEASKSIKLIHHVQSYGEDGTGITIDRSQATLVSQSSITTNGTQTLTFLMNSLPGAVLTDVRGEERFSLYSLADAVAPESLIASQFIQIWPTPELRSVTGITPDETYRMAMPPVTVTLKNLYPGSNTYLQFYKGPPVLGTVGAVVPLGVSPNPSPEDKTIVVEGTRYDEFIDSDGPWTMEVLTDAPFNTPTIRLSAVTFNVDRMIEVNNTTITTME